MPVPSSSAGTNGISPRMIVLYYCRQNFLNKRERSISELSERYLSFFLFFFSFSVFPVVSEKYSLAVFSSPNTCIPAVIAGLVWY